MMRNWQWVFGLVPPAIMLAVVGMAGVSLGATPQIRAGENHTVMLRTNGSIWTCGDNDLGQLGNGSNTAKAAPTPGISPVSGDVDEDGDVTITDAVRALRIGIGLATPGAAEVIAGDVGPLAAGNVPTPDGVVTIGDAVVILRKVVGLVSF